MAALWLDNRPNFSGIAQWLDENDSEINDDSGAGKDYLCPEIPDDIETELEPRYVDAASPEFARVWRPLTGSGREPRPGLLVSVVRAGDVVAYPTPLPDPPVGAVARALARLGGEVPGEVKMRLPEVLAVEGGSVEAEAAPEPEPEPVARRVGEASQKAYAEIRMLVGMLVEVLAGRRAPSQASAWVDASVRETLRAPGRPTCGKTAALRRVRLSAVAGAPERGVEALALVQDGGRMRAVALRFDVVDGDGGAPGGTRWRCTALQTA